MIDRSISSLRTLRPETEFDKSIFWFRDDLHQPYPISPMGMTTVQVHHAWGYHVAAEATKLPPSKGGHVKIYRGRVYLGFALIDDPDEIAKREPEFGKIVDACLEDWDAYYQKYIGEVISNLETLNVVDRDTLSLPELLEHLKKAEKFNRRNWEIHFILMYPADAVYFMFEDYCKNHGLEEKDLVSMLRGFKSVATETDQELWNLATFSEECGIRDLLLTTDVDDLMDKLNESTDAGPWLDKLDRFLSKFGNRVVAAHLDVTTPTWAEDPRPVLDTIKGYFKRMDEGWDFFRSKEEIRGLRDRAIQDFEDKLKDGGEKKGFRRLLKATQGVYAFQEDHGFYIDQGSTAALHNAVKACGRRLFQWELLDSVDDVFFLTFHDLLETMEALIENEAIAKYHYKALVPNLVAERKEDAQKAAEMDAPLTFGNVPKKMTDPIGIKVFGIIDEILHPKGEQEVADRLEGFPGAPGVVEGPAKVILDYKDFQKVQAGEILVCPYTGTAWTPLFVKIGGVVTDTGGMLTHAAIAAREYNIPAVVGTWNATNSINDGDIIKVNGDEGVVEVLKRAK